MRMRPRRISECQVVGVLNEPDRSYASGDKLVVERVTALGNTLHVVYVELDEGLTAFVTTVIRIGRSRA